MVLASPRTDGGGPRGGYEFFLQIIRQTSSGNVVLFLVLNFYVIVKMF